MDSYGLERYTRHILLKEIGGPGQLKLSNSKITMIGAGGLGSIALYYLVASGVGSIKIVDNDIVSLSNLQRQILFEEADIGIKKVLAAKKNLLKLNPHIKITTLEEQFTKENSSNVLRDSDLIIDGTDNFKSKATLCREAYKHKLPLIYGGLSQWEGQICLFDPKLPSVCFDCIYPNAPTPIIEESCSDLGVIGPVVGIIGSIMAAEAIKFLTSAGLSLANHILTYDCLHAEFQKFKIEKRSNCSICSFEK